MSTQAPPQQISPVPHETPSGRGLHGAVLCPRDKGVWQTPQTMAVAVSAGWGAAVSVGMSGGSGVSVGGMG